MQSDGRQLYRLHGIHLDIGDGGVLEAVCTLEVKGPGTGGYVAEFILAVVEGHRIDGIRTTDADDGGAGSRRQHDAFDFGGHLVIEYGDERIEQDLSVPEEDGPLQIEVEPHLELVVGHVVDIRSCDIYGEIWIGAEDHQGIVCRAVVVDRVVRTQRDPDLDDLTRGVEAR